MTGAGLHGADGAPGAGGSAERVPVRDLASLVARAATLWPEQTAWVFDQSGERFTFSQVHERSSALAGALASHGVEAGDRVAVMLRNVPEFSLLWLALAKLGAALVPVNTNYRELDGEHVLAHSGAKLAVCAPEFTELLNTIAPRTTLRAVLTPDQLGTGEPFDGPVPAPEHPVNIQYTSGTTGAPKGCVLPHEYWITLADGLITEYPHIGPDDVVITAQPFHYIDPQWNVALGLASGATLVVLDRFHPSSFWSKVCEHGVTWLYCLGLMPTLLLRQPPSELDRAHRLRAVHASAIPHDLHADLERRWGVPWFEAFGMTETGGDLRVRPEDHDELVGTGCIGTPVGEREAAVVDEQGRPVPTGEVGELVLRGPAMMLRYHDNPEATEDAFRGIGGPPASGGVAGGGWFHTGDLAKTDEQGRVYYLGRTKDMIRRSGENVSADEVERALCTHPGVRLAAVLAVPDELRGEEIKAYLVPENGAAVDVAEIADYCADKLAYFKVPRYWTVVEELPMTPSERVAKGELRKGVADLRAGAWDRAEKVWR